jgi:hypothetical protein
MSRPWFNYEIDNVEDLWRHKRLPAEAEGSYERRDVKTLWIRKHIWKAEWHKPMKNIMVGWRWPQESIRPELDDLSELNDLTALTFTPSEKEALEALGPLPPGPSLPSPQGLYLDNPSLQSYGKTMTPTTAGAVSGSGFKMKTNGKQTATTPQHLGIKNQPAQSVRAIPPLSRKARISSTTIKTLQQQRKQQQIREQRSSRFSMLPTFRMARVRSGLVSDTVFVPRTMDPSLVPCWETEETPRICHSRRASIVGAVDLETDLPGKVSGPTGASMSIVVYGGP